MTKDIQIYDTTDGGEIDPQLIAEYPLASAAYLSLFGGNAQDDGSANNNATWWGNLLESDPNYKQVSKTQYALASLNLTPLNLHKFKANALADLNWILALGIAETLDVVVTIPALNSIHFEITVDGVIILEQTYNAAAGGTTDDTDTETPIGNIVAPPTNLAYDANTMALTGNSSLPSVTIHIYDENLVFLDTYQVVPVDGAFSLDVSTYPSGTYCANAFATDSSGASSVTTACIEFTHVVFNAPYDLTAAYDGTNVDLTWSSDGEQDYFIVYRDGEVIATGVTDLAYTDTTTTTGSTYEYRVASYKDGIEKSSTVLEVSTVLVDPEFDNVDYLVMVDGGVIVDKSNNARAVTNVGGATVSGDQIVFNGSNYLYLDTDNLQNRNFTIEWFASRNLSVSDQFMGLWSGSSEGNYPSVFWGFGVAYLNANSSSQDGSAVSNNSDENHWCIEYDNVTGIAYLFYNGTKIAQIAQGVPGWNSNSAKIALTQGGGNKFFTGNMRAIRCTLDVLRYDVTGFTPPTSFPTSA